MIKNKLLILVLFPFIFYCCRTNRNLFPHRVQLIEDTLSLVVKEYARQSFFNKKKNFVSIEYSSDSGVVNYLITAGKSRQGYTMYPPEYFALIDEVLVLISFTDNKMIKIDGIENEIDLIAQENNVKLENQLAIFDPPVWALERCAGNYRLSTKMQIKVGNHSPCASFSGNFVGNIVRVRPK